MLYALAKNKSQGYFSPADFGIVINLAQKEYQAFLLGNLPQYTPGRPTANTELGQNLPVRQRLTPSIYQYHLGIDPTGFSPYPGDYIQADAMWSIYGLNSVSIYNYNRIRFVQQHNLISHLKSVINPVATNPIYLIEDRGFRFFPTTQGQATLSYVRHVPDIVWGYTLDSNGRPVYSQVNSVNPIWDDAAMAEIIARALLLAGVNLQASVVMQYANDIKKTGQ